MSAAGRNDRMSVGMTPDWERLLRAAFDAGVDEGDRGFASNSEELDIAFAVFVRRAAATATREANR